MLFLIIHQTFELWFKQVIYELQAVVSFFQQPMLREADSTRVLHHLQRVCAILKLATTQFDVLETMTPRDFMAFRDSIYPASGFQSHQFRLLENLLGMDPQRRVKYQNSAYHSHLSPQHQQLVLDSEKAPTLLQGVQHWLERTPFVKLENFDFMETYKAAVVRMYDADAELLSKSFDTSTAEGRATLEGELKKSVGASCRVLLSLSRRVKAENRDNFLAMFDEEKHEALMASGLKTLSFRATQVMRVC
jgi:tryptophan 2,3-dioxygenase